MRAVHQKHATKNLILQEAWGLGNIMTVYRLCGGDRVKEHIQTNQTHFVSEMCLV